MIPEPESSAGAYHHVLDEFQRRLGHERTLFAREELLIIHEFDRISVVITARGGKPSFDARTEMASLVRPKPQRPDLPPIMKHYSTKTSPKQIFPKQT